MTEHFCKDPLVCLTHLILGLKIFQVAVIKKKEDEMGSGRDRERKGFAAVMGKEAGEHGSGGGGGGGKSGGTGGGKNGKQNDGRVYKEFLNREKERRR